MKNNRKKKLKNSVTFLMTDEEYDVFVKQFKKSPKALRYAFRTFAKQYEETPKSVGCTHRQFEYNDSKQLTCNECGSLKKDIETYEEYNPPCVKFF